MQSDRKELIEITFYDVDDLKVEAAIRVRALGAVAVDSDEPPGCEVVHLAKKIRDARSSSEPFCIAMTVGLLSVGRARIDDVLIQLLLCNGTSDLSISFWSTNERNALSREVMSALAAGVQDLAREIGAEEFACGLDPARDPSTQLFNSRGIGPFSF